MSRGCFRTITRRAVSEVVVGLSQVGAKYAPPPVQKTPHHHCLADNISVTAHTHQFCWCYRLQQVVTKAVAQHNITTSEKYVVGSSC